MLNAIETKGPAPGIRKDLFWLASWPKSGNTWMRAMFSAYINGGHIDINRMVGTFGDKDGYSLARVSPVPMSELSIADRLSLRAAQMAHVQEVAFFHPVIVKTHSICRSVLGYPADVPGQCKGAVYIVRDPRDVAISYANHMGVDIDHAIASMGSEGNALKDGETGQTISILGSWTEHVRSWLGEHPYPVTVIPYEEMKKNPEWALTSFLKVIGWQVDEGIVKKAAEACEFSRLQKQEKERGFKEGSESADRFFRKGVSGGWTEVLSTDQVRRIEEDHGELMQELGYLQAKAA